MAYTRLKKTKLIRHRLHTLSKNEYLKVFILRLIGNFLVLSSLFMIGKTFYQPLREEIRYFIEQKTGKKYQVVEKIPNNDQPPADQSSNNKGSLAKTIGGKKIEFLVPVDPQFSIVVPKIAANARILANIDAADEKIYLPALQKGVAHAAGTTFPGEGGHIFLFAHSTDYFWNVGYYNAVFYLLSKLEKGDEVNLFYQGKRYVYRVVGKEIVDPSRVDFLTRKSNREFLTLQTCWPPGTTLKRLLVFATKE